MTQPDLQSAAVQALIDIAKGGHGNGDLNKAMGYSGAETSSNPKSFFTDPFQYLDHLGIGYRETPSELTYGTLKAMADRDPVIAAIIHTRQNQVASFCHRPENKYSVGFRVLHKDRKRKITEGERRFMHDTEEFLLNTGVDRNDERDDFETFIRKIVQDSLRFDQINFEVIPRYNSQPASFLAVDASTIRFLKPKRRKGAPAKSYEEYKRPRYCQVIEGRIVTEYMEDELAFGVRNPRTDIYAGGYGRSELEDLILTITGHLWSEQWNRNVFSQGSTTKGVFLVKGAIPPAQMESFRRMWAAQVSGVQNAWKTPILNADDATWLNMQPTNNEMGFQLWMEYLIKVATAVYQIDPAEINFDMRAAGMNAPMFMTTNEAQQKVSKDRGLNPLLRFIAKIINKKLISKIDDNFEFAFVGLDQKSEEQAIQLRLQELGNYKTLNEVREEEDLPPVKYGDIPLNPTYTAYKGQQEAMKAQAAQGGQPGQPGAGGPPGGGPQPQPAEEAQQPGGEGETAEEGKVPFDETERDAGEQINGFAPQQDEDAAFAMSTHDNLRKSINELVLLPI